MKKLFIGSLILLSIISCGKKEEELTPEVTANQAVFTTEMRCINSLMFKVFIDNTGKEMYAPFPHPTNHFLCQYYTYLINSGMRVE